VLNAGLRKAIAGEVPMRAVLEEVASLDQIILQELKRK